jgi:hypothetical protein
MARYGDMFMPPSMEDDESDEEIGASGTAAHRAKPRRKSHQRPQVRQISNCTEQLLLVGCPFMSILCPAMLVSTHANAEDVEAM